MNLDKAIYTLFNLMYNNANKLTRMELEALNIAISALKTIQDMQNNQ